MLIKSLIGEVEKICDRISILSKGKIITQGTIKRNRTTDGDNIR